MLITAANTPAERRRRRRRITIYRAGRLDMQDNRLDVDVLRRRALYMQSYFTSVGRFRPDNFPVGQ